MPVHAGARHLTFVMNPPFTDAMKHRLWLAVPLAFALTAVCEAQDIHKCISGNTVTYQNMPCASTQIDAGLLRLPGYADPAERDGATSPPSDVLYGAPSDGPLEVSPPPAVPDTRRAFPFRTSIALGMTDDQVLNLQSWGRPSRIVRNGRHQGWREIWTYERGGASRALAFVDGRLASIDADDRAIQVAAVARRDRPL